MGKRLDTWLDEECRNMAIALSKTPDRTAEFREAMTHTTQGQYLLLFDKFGELWAAIRDALLRPCCPLRKR